MHIAIGKRQALPSLCRTQVNSSIATPTSAGKLLIESRALPDSLLPSYSWGVPSLLISPVTPTLVMHLVRKPIVLLWHGLLLVSGIWTDLLVRPEAAHCVDPDH